MSQKKIYTKAFRQQALEKVYNRGDRTVQVIAEELNLNPWTLKNWTKLPKESVGRLIGLYDLVNIKLEIAIDTKMLQRWRSSKYTPLSS